MPGYSPIMSRLPGKPEVTQHERGVDVSQYRARNHHAIIDGADRQDDRQFKK